MHRCAPAPHIRQKRTNTAANSELEFAPAGYFTAVLSVFQAHLPARRHSPCEASGLEKPGARNHQTIQIRQSVIVRLTGLTVTSRDATVDTVTYSRMSPSAGFTPAGVSGTIWIGDRFHPVVSCCWRRGFYRPRGGLKLMFDQFGFSGGWERRKGRGGK